MTIKECIDVVDNLKPNQYSLKEKVMWLSFIDEIIINDVLKTHEGYDGRYDEFAGYSEDKLSVPLIVSNPYDRLYTAYLKMKIDSENGETARYNNSAALFNSYMMEYRKYYNKTHMPLDMTKQKPKQTNNRSYDISDAMIENLKRELHYLLSEDFAKMVSHDRISNIVTNYISTNREVFKGKDGEKGDKGDKGDTGVYVGSGNMPDDCNVQIDPNGESLTLKALYEEIEKIVNRVINAYLPTLDKKIDDAINGSIGEQLNSIYTEVDLRINETITAYLPTLYGQIDGAINARIGEQLNSIYSVIDTKIEEKISDALEGEY